MMQRRFHEDKTSVEIETSYVTRSSTHGSGKNKQSHF